MNRNLTKWQTVVQTIASFALLALIVAPFVGYAKEAHAVWDVILGLFIIWLVYWSVNALRRIERKLDTPTDSMQRVNWNVQHLTNVTQMESMQRMNLLNRLGLLHTYNKE